MITETEKQLLKIIADMDGSEKGAYNIRANGQTESRQVNENVDIITKTDKQGIDIIIKAGAKGETVHIPVIIGQSGLKESVYNDFYIGDNADVTIMAGCGIHNCGSDESRHDGIHTFYVGKNARVKYIERHYGEGEGEGQKNMNPTTVVNIDKNGYMEMETSQIKGIDNTCRITRGTINEGGTLIVHEKIMTHKNQIARTDFSVDLNGDGSSANVVSRSVAKDNSLQEFVSNINGNAACTGHTECDAIIMDSAHVTASPKLGANHIDASLIHEAAIGKIAGEQLIKLMTLGLDEANAEEEIINGFLK